MAGASTNRFLIIGGSGSGKSTLSEAIVEEYATLGRYRYLVVLTKDAPEHSRLSEFCNAAQELTDEIAAAGVDWRAAIQAAGSLFLEVTALPGDELRDTLDALGQAVLDLGDVLVVVDEAQQIVDRNTPPRLLQLYTRGRKHGVHIITITQSIKQQATWGLHPTAIREATALVTFLKHDRNEVKQISEIFPELGDRVSELRTPRDGAPEYAVKDLITGRSVIVTRAGEVDITAGSSAPPGALT